MEFGEGEIYHVPKKNGAKIQKLNLKTYEPIIQSISSNSNDRKRCLLSPKNENLDDEKFTKKNSGSVLKKLFELCLDFVAENAHEIESLEGFPLQMGEQIWKRCLDVKSLFIKTQ